MRVVKAGYFSRFLDSNHDDLNYLGKMRKLQASHKCCSWKLFFIAEKIQETFCDSVFFLEKKLTMLKQLPAKILYDRRLRRYAQSHVYKDLLMLEHHCSYTSRRHLCRRLVETRRLLKHDCS